MHLYIFDYQIEDSRSEGNLFNRSSTPKNKKGFAILRDICTIFVYLYYLPVEMMGRNVLQSTYYVIKKYKKNYSTVTCVNIVMVAPRVCKCVCMYLNDCWRKKLLITYSFAAETLDSDVDKHSVRKVTSFLPMKFHEHIF